eukprot:TRINITY_DN4366_c2_g1_i5.p1 TRINITY_DN4366_c2_g1~~TRINITY_DN4366_c2_g1_i5.p1  ORF type:complete len:109 (-),score=21.89 TRINITY_DN4366_c2_g1_i5:931-1257(-)
MVPSVAHSSNPGGTSLVSSSLSWASSGPRAIPAFGLHIGCILATWTLSTKFVFQFSFNLLDQQGEKTVTSHESDFPFDPDGGPAESFVSSMMKGKITKASFRCFMGCV